jgi:hypothetical protein
MGDTWEWDGTAWTERSTSGPAAHYSHSLAYDSARGVTVLYGGVTPDASSQIMGDTWEWDGTAWTERSESGPSFRYSHSLAYDSARAVTVLYGGVYRPTPDAVSQIMGDTWTMAVRPDPDITEQPLQVASYPGRQANFSVSVSGTGTLAFQWRKDGVSLQDGGRFAGVHTSELTVNYLGFADAGAYDVVVSGPAVRPQRIPLR